MQETLEKQITISAEARSIGRIADDERIYGEVQAATNELIIDEEKTHAAEIIAKLSGSADIPRSYRKVGNDLVDPHGTGLRSVLDGGRRDIAEKQRKGVLGADKEANRRDIESRNYDEIICQMPEGFACVEISATDATWTKEEQEEHGYTGDTLIRVTARLNEQDFLQGNIVVQESSIQFVNQIREVFDRFSEGVSSADEALASASVVGVDGDFESFMKTLKRRVAECEAAINPAASAVKMLKTYIQKQRDAWQFVSEQPDVFEELVDAFKIEAKNKPEYWHEGANRCRIGAWQELCDRFEGKSATKRGEIISRGQGRALAAQKVFIACGGKVGALELLQAVGSPADRFLLALSLKTRAQGVGMCMACFSSGELFGCGVFCGGCNEIWCDEYAATGRELDASAISAQRYLNYSRP